MKRKSEQVKHTSIGGQAVIEGVMMRGESSMAIAVRDEDGIIRVESKRLKPNSERSKFSRLPLIRGIVSFFDSFCTGTRTLMRSADVFGEGEPSRFEKWVAEKLKVDVMKVVTSFALIVGLLLAVFLFMWLPQFCRGLLERLFDISFGIWAKNFIEGGLKLLIFILYILLASLLKDIKRTFMYHGAEHKTISCYEKGLELTVENAKKCTRVHDRCGTTFMVFVMVISILLFACVESLLGGKVENIFRILLKLALLPIVAGLSYELLKALSKTKSPIVLPLKIPGLLLQRITTREPDDKMLEVAISSFNTVMAMDADKTIKEKQFIVSKKRSELLVEVQKELASVGIDESAEAEWIVSIALGLKRDQVKTKDMVKPVLIDKVYKIVEQRKKGRPLWYCIGDTNFYGYTINVDERVLIPRPETELLVENAFKLIDSSKKVLDLCTGSGAIAIAVKKESNADVTAIDVSEDALSLAKENAKLNEANIKFIKSNMFEELDENIDKFDLIISNPPYVKREDISGLQTEVKDFEPVLALDGGSDGLDFYRIIAKNAKFFLKPNGGLLLECGIGQAEQISKMLIDFSSVEIIKDYENIERIVKAVL